MKYLPIFRVSRELSFVAELDNKIVGHFLFSHFPLSPTKQGGHNDETDTGIVMLAPVSVHADYFRQGIGTAMHDVSGNIRGSIRRYTGLHCL